MNIHFNAILISIKNNSFENVSEGLQFCSDIDLVIHKNVLKLLPFYQRNFQIIISGMEILGSSNKISVSKILA